MLSQPLDLPVGAGGIGHSIDCRCRSSCSHCPGRSGRPHCSGFHRRPVPRVGMVMMMLMMVVMVVVMVSTGDLGKLLLGQFCQGDVLSTGRWLKN